MRKLLEFLYLLAITLNFANASPKFGERIKKENNNSTLIEVFRPSLTAPKPTVETPNQIQSSDPNEKNSPNNAKDFSDERHIEYKFSAFDQNDDNNSHDFGSAQPDLEPRPGIEPARPQHPFPLQLDFDSFHFNFPDVPEVSGSEHINGVPLPPPPPQVPHQVQPDFHKFGHREPNYETNENRQSFQETAPNHGLGPEFTFSLPQGFPHPKQDPRADYKKELMGAENKEGKPWGTKMSYSYRDPKDPNNYMQMSEVRMSVNREMDPQEAQSQVQKFLMAAQNGQYGPMRPIHVQDQHSDEEFDRHPNHNYDPNDAHESHYAPNEPHEPNEPKFPNF